MIVAAVWAPASATYCAASLRRDVLEHDLQRREVAPQRHEVALDEYRLAVEDIDVGIGDLAVDEQRHAASASASSAGMILRMSVTPASLLVVAPAGRA